MDTKKLLVAAENNAACFKRTLNERVNEFLERNEMDRRELLDACSLDEVTYCDFVAGLRDVGFEKLNRLMTAIEDDEIRDIERNINNAIEDEKANVIKDFEPRTDMREILRVFNDTKPSDIRPSVFEQHSDEELDELIRVNSWDSEIDVRHATRDEKIKFLDDKERILTSTRDDEDEVKDRLSALGKASEYISSLFGKDADGTDILNKIYNKIRPSRG